MAEKHHVKTVPGENVAPEIVPGAVHPEPGGHTQADDINVSLVAVLGVFFGALLLVMLVALQAWFYNRADAEQEAKRAPQGAPGTELAVAEEQWHDYLYTTGTRKDPTDPKGERTVSTVAIDSAMAEVVKHYGKPKASDGK